MSSKKSVADARVQFTLRLDPHFHAKLVESAGFIPLNAFIIHALEVYLQGIDTDRTLTKAEIFLEEGERLRREADQKLKRAEEMLRAQSVPSAEAEAYEAGRRATLDEMKSLIRETIADSVEEAFERKSQYESLRRDIEAGIKTKR